MDCSLALRLDPKYVKALHRRATCCQRLKKFEVAKKDLEEMLKLEPNNKLAQTELNQVLQLIDTRQLVFPVAKREQDKSKKTLKRILIEEINDDSLERAAVEKQQEEMKQKVQLNSEEQKLFEVGITKADKPKIEEIAEDLNKKVSVKEEANSDPKVAKKIQPIREAITTTITTAAVAKRTIPEVPKNGYQFRKDWQFLSSSSDDLASYFKQISPSQYKDLFMNGLESDYLSKILVIFKGLYMR